MWIPDLSPIFGFSNAVAVGWLERGRPYPTGDVPLAVFEQLQNLLEDPWQPFAAGGFHGCDICLFHPEKRGARNVFVPGNDRVYVAPELVLHYMNAHGYCPPEKFCEAVVACPQMRSQEYRRALIAAGGSELLRGQLPRLADNR